MALHCPIMGQNATVAKQRNLEYLDFQDFVNKKQITE